MAEFENVRLYEPKKRMPHIVAIGGGHGLSAMLRGLKRYTKFITAIVTVADDGGGSGMLREDLGMLPPGDIRNCIMSLANTEPTMQKLLNYRFTEGSLAGQSFGNLFLAAMNGISGSFDEAVHRMGDVLAITGRVLPVTNQDVRLEAEFHDGSRVLGESKIFYAKKINNSRIRKVRLVPERPAALPESVRAIREADIVVIGPGSLYTSIIPNFLVSGIADAVRQSRALKIYVLNIMTQDGETDGYDADDHVRAHVRRLGPLNKFAVAVVDHAQNVRFALLAERDQLPDLRDGERRPCRVALRALDGDELCFGADCGADAVKIERAVRQQVDLPVLHAVFHQRTLGRTDADDLLQRVIRRAVRA